VILFSRINQNHLETWDGWFNSGWLECLGVRFDYTEGEGRLFDHTAGSVDSFTIHAIPYRSFYCATTGYTIRLWVTTATGAKPTGQSGQKEVDRGATWSGMAILTRPPVPPDPAQTIEFTVVGTWDTEYYYDYFNYVPATPTYSANWYFGSSTPVGIITRGEGGSAGDRVDYRP